MTTDPKKAARNSRRRDAYAAKKLKANLTRNMQVVDAFTSTTTGAGLAGIDKFKSYTFTGREDITEETLECLYLDNDIAATVVERVVLDAMRGGYGLTWTGATDEETREARDWAEAKLNVTEVVKRARIYSRLFGGGAVLIGSEGGSLKAPPTEGAPIAFLRAIASKDLKAVAWNADPAAQDFSTVARYDYDVPTFATGETRRTGTGGPERLVNQVELHSDHVKEFYGLLTTDDRFRETGWGDSVLRRVYDVLLQFEAAFQSIQHALTENSVPVYKVEGLLEMLQSENWELLQTRFQLLNTGKSNYRAIVLGENESFERVNAPLTEAANVVETAMNRVAGAAGMSATILFGRSPAGMNATGQSDLEIWNQQVAKEQFLVLGPALRDLYTKILADPESPVKNPEGLDIVFPSLWTPSLQDEINQYAQRAGADAAYINSRVLRPEEVAIARASEPGQFPAGIDIDGRKEALTMDPVDLMNQMMPGDEPADDDEEKAPEDKISDNSTPNA